MVPQSLEYAILQCPVCQHNSIQPGGDDALCCTHCGQQFASRHKGIYSLLPPHLEPVKQGEDGVYAINSTEYQHIASRPWRKIVQRPDVMRVDEEILPLLPVGRFLELGGESCFSSAIYKSVHPDAMVYASDVSPNSLCHVALPIAAMFPRQPDVFLALDAETLPFVAASFDAVLALTMMHHLPNPIRMLREVDRILAPGGVFVAVDHAVPRHFRWLFQRTARDRALTYGIQEELLSYPTWVSVVHASPLPASSIHIYTNPRYQTNPLFHMAGHGVNHIPRVISRYLFPVGMMIIYTKPHKTTPHSTL